MKHRLTPVQRKVIRWMAEDQGQLRIETGHKTTQLVEGDGDVDNIVLCQSLVQYFLIHHGYIEKAGGIAMYRLTEKGRRSA